MKIFVLQNPKAGRGDAVTDYLPIDGSRLGEAPRCHVCGKFVGMLPLLPAIRVELEAWGTGWGDIAFGPGDQILVSSKLKNAFVQAKLVGFERFEPVEIVKTRRRKAGVGDPPEYWLATVVRSRAVLDEHASAVEREGNQTPCSECGLDGVFKRLRRIVLQTDTRPSEDVFFARGLPGTVLVSERFRDLCEANGLANCELVAAEEFTIDYYPQEKSAGERRH